MDYLDDLRHFLLRRTCAPGGTEVPPVAIDVASHRRYLISKLGELGNRATIPIGWPGLLDTAGSSGADDYLELFITELAREVGEGSSRPVGASELNRLLHVAAGHEKKARPIAPNKTIEEEALTRHVKRVIDRVHLAADEGMWRLVDRYAFEVRLTRTQNSRTSIGAPGRVLLELPGSDAVRWVLTLEVLQSMGPKDDWRMSRETAHALLRQPSLELTMHHEYDDFLTRQWCHSPCTIKRLAALGLIEFVYPSENGELAVGYRLLERGRILLEELVSEKETPFSALAKALIEDETSLFFESRLGSNHSETRGMAAQANTRHARMIAHEVRNALVPVKTALTALYREAGESSGGAVDRYRSRIDGGIERVFAFAEEQLRVAALIPGGSEVFDALPALRDAVAVAREQGATAVAFEPPESAAFPMLSGTRSRFVMAITNLLRNATQAASLAKDARIELGLRQEGHEGLEILVDDNGPGVPTASRKAIFENGFSGRPGGSGHGLALVREVIETEMQGHVFCEDSPLGGARFRLTLSRRSQ